MNDFIQKLLDDIHNINPELALKRQTEYNQNFVNKALNEQCDIHVVGSSTLIENNKKLKKALHQIYTMQDGWVGEQVDKTKKIIQDTFKID